MSDPKKDNKLARGQQHVEGGKRIIAAQQQLIEEIKTEGRDTTEAQSMLDSFRRTQAMFEDDVRDLAEREKAAPSTWPSPVVKYIAFACPHCGKPGAVVWKDDGQERNFVRISDGFHVEEGRVSGARHVIICDACDEIDPPRLYP
jgi:hypothetical protein